MVVCKFFLMHISKNDRIILLQNRKFDPPFSNLLCSTNERYHTIDLCFEKGLCYVKLYENNIHISNFLYTHNINFLVIQIPNFQHSIYFTTRNKSDAVFHLRASGFSHKPNQISLYFLLLLIHFLILIYYKTEDI